MRECIEQPVRGGFLGTLATYLIVAAIVCFLAGCKTVDTVPDPKVEVHVAKVAIPTPCVVNRPAEPPRLRDQIPATNWAGIAPGAKAQAVKAQAGARMNYEDELRAATSHCPSAAPP